MYETWRNATFFNREAESRQALELANRKLQADMKGKEQTIMKNELDITELKSNLDSAKEAKNFQVKLIVFATIIWDSIL